MKIKAIRVAEVGCFNSPVALEGLSGGLDVLSGPNELGKSTLLKALHTVFAEKYTSTSKVLKNRLVPYGGGSPLVEVDFEIGGDAYQLRKRYFTAKSAELRRVGKNEIARNADAEERLDALLAEHGGGGRLALFWVEQGAGLTPAGAGDAETSLRAALENEVALVAGGTTVRAVQSAVRKRIDDLRTASRSQAKGPYKDAKTEQERLTRDHAEAAKSRELADLRLENLARARTERQQLTDAEIAEARATEVMAARQAVIAATAAQQRLREAEAAWQHQDAVRALAVSTHEIFARNSAEHANLLASAAVNAGALATAERQRTTAQDALTQARTGAGIAEQAEAERRTELEQAEQAERDRKDAKRSQREQAKLQSAVSDCVRLIALIEPYEAALAHNPVDDTLLRRIEAETADIRALEAELAAALPIISVDLLPQAAGTVRLDGVPIHTDARVFLRPYSVLDISGIGRITITAAGAATTKEAADDLAARFTTLADLLVRAESADLAMARDRHQQRQRIEKQLHEAQVRLSVLAPHGPAALAAELADASARLSGIAAGEGGDLPIDVKLYADQLAAAIAARRTAAMAVNRAVDTERAATELYLGIKARHDEQGRRLTALSAELPRESERAAHATELARTAIAAESAAREALLVRQALRETTPASEQCEAMRRALTRAEEAEAQAIARLAQLEREIAGHEAALERDLAEGIEERLADLADRLTMAGARVAEFERELAALTLLDARLEAAEKHTHQRYVIPASAALAPYLTTVFPAAELSMGKGFTPEGLVRSGRLESVSVLSDGTKEQVAILARLGFAAIEADAGRPFPVILDDALVYADDARIARMFDSLTSAARRHQVIVLTCRERAFAGIGGHRLRLANWPQALAA